jgi:hypothetical protein
MTTAGQIESPAEGTSTSSINRDCYCFSSFGVYQRLVHNLLFSNLPLWYLDSNDDAVLIKLRVILPR